MGSLVVGERMAIRAVKSLRMQGFEKILVALLFIEKIGRREIASWRLLRALIRNRQVNRLEFCGYQLFTQIPT
jgi:hypothetical protein